VGSFEHGNEPGPFQCVSHTFMTQLG